MAETFLATVSFLLLAALSCVAASRPLQDLQSDVRRADTIRAGQDFDYFVFVRQWVGKQAVISAVRELKQLSNYKTTLYFCEGTVCEEHACPLVHVHGSRFTIHGLWPNYDGRSFWLSMSNDSFRMWNVSDVYMHVLHRWILSSILCQELPIQ
jgi:hypothetical protein